MNSRKMIDFQTIFEHIREILPTMNFQRHGAQWRSPKNADGSTPKHARNDKTVIKQIGGIIVVAENGGWGCHRLPEFLKLHFSETELREIYATYSDKDKQNPPRQDIDYDAHANAAEFLANCHKHLGEDDIFCNYLEFRGLSVEKIYEKTNIGGYSGSDERLRGILGKMHVPQKEFARLNSCKSIVLPLFSRGILTGLAFRYVTEKQTPKCEKIRLSERYGGLCYQHGTPQPNIQSVCIVEGEFDAISANLIGSPNIHFVATCGHAHAESALKELRLIYPNADIFAAFDNDETGTRYVTEFQQIDETIADIRNAFAPSKDINEFLANGGDFQRVIEEIDARTTTPFAPITLSEIWNTAKTNDYATDFPIIENGEITNLILPTGVTIVAAPTGHGKSTILQNMALREAFSGSRIIYITVEESKENVLFYLFSAFCASRGVRIPTTKIRRREIDIFKECRELADEFDKLMKEHMIVSGYEDSVEKLISDIAKHAKRAHIDAIYVDYVQLLFSEAQNTRNELQIKATMKVLRTISDALHIRVIAAAQYNRSGAKFGEQSLTNLGEGGDIERAASMVISIFQISQIDEKDLESESFVKLIKNHTDVVYSQNGADACGVSLLAAKPEDFQGCVFVKVLKNRIGNIGASAVWNVDYSTRHVLARIKPKQTEITPMLNDNTCADEFAKIAANLSHFEADIY